MGKDGGMTNEERHASAKERFEERAGILEFMAHYPRAEAERIAKREVSEWLKAHRPDDEVQP